MANSYMTSSELVKSVKRRASIPESQITFTEQDLLDLANEELAIGLVPSILQTHEEYFVYPHDVPLVNGKSKYPIPYRAIGNRVREVSYVDESGGEFPMTRVNPEDSYGNNANLGLSGPRKFKFEGGNVVLLNGQNAQYTGSLRFKYFLRPNVIVKLNRGAQVTAIDFNTGVITFSAPVPVHFSLNILFDFNRTKPDHRIISFDVAATAVGASSITFAPANIPEDLEVGDYLCQSGETVIPNIPTDLHVVLTQRVGTRCLEALGDTQGLQNANQKLAEMEMKTNTLIDNRSEGNPQKVINRTSTLKSSVWRRSRRSF